MTRPDLPPCVFEHVAGDASSPAILCVHPGGLSSKHFALLAAAAPGASLYVAELGANIRYVEAGDERTPAEGVIEALSADVIRDFEIASGGKTISALVGWSFGGVIAHEIAMRLCEVGGPDLPVLAIDSMAPVQKYKFDWIASALSVKNLAKQAGERERLAEWFVQYLNSLKGKEIKVSRREIAAHDEAAMLDMLLQRSIAAGAFPEGTSQAGFSKVYREFRRGMTRNTRLLAEYHADGPARDVVLVRAKRPFFPIFRLFRAMGWDALASSLKIVTLDADHYQLIADECRMRDIAKQLATTLNSSPSLPPASATAAAAVRELTS